MLLSAFRQINECLSKRFGWQCWGDGAVGWGEGVREWERSPDGWVQSERRNQNGDQAQSQRARVIIAQWVWKMDGERKSADKNRKPHALSQRICTSTVCEIQWIPKTSFYFWFCFVMFFGLDTYSSPHLSLFIYKFPDTIQASCSHYPSFVPVDWLDFFLVSYIPYTYSHFLVLLCLECNEYNLWPWCTQCHNTRLRENPCGHGKSVAQTAVQPGPGTCSYEAETLPTVPLWPWLWMLTSQPPMKDKIV